MKVRIIVVLMVLAGVFSFTVNAQEMAADASMENMDMMADEGMMDETMGMEGMMADEEMMANEEAMMDEAMQMEALMADIDEDDMDMDEMDDEEITAEAEATVYSTSDPDEILADVVFLQTPTGLIVEADFYGVEGAGNHGFHIHENGSCEDAGNAASGHFNPYATAHGFLPNDGVENAHIGDMGNIEIDEDGDGYLSITLPGVTLMGDENNVAGKAIIIHALEDDFGQPTGNAGGRIGCGIIEVIE